VNIAFSIVTPMTERIDAYADLIVRVGANVQPGQTVYVAALVEHAPLTRAIARAGYAAGARLVDVRYVDQHVYRSFVEHAADEDLTRTTPWLMARTEALSDGGALIMIAGDPEPELLADLDQARVGKARPVDAMNRQLKAQNARTVNWTIAAFPTEGQATQVFGEPDVERLWEAIAHSVRLDEDDPVAAWREHVERLAVRVDLLLRDQSRRRRGGGARRRDADRRLPQVEQCPAPGEPAEQIRADRDREERDREVHERGMELLQPHGHSVLGERGTAG